MDWTTILCSLAGLIAGGGITTYFTIGTDRAKAKLDLLKDAMAEISDKTKLIRELQTEVLCLHKEIHLREMKLLSTRCDIQSCPHRKPPLPWMGGGSATYNDDPVSTTDPISEENLEADEELDPEEESESIVPPISTIINHT